ncbi:hypothetical protein MVEN_02187100 [Mycena venus]|uniref:Uncharacterized protein n=1 Tax=Mycena venus TaxID=2733690 RepID=A0A8H7CGE1_9AGAR|nr:hypothetical protein MVEN_02187100 [Mycena venus]
MSYVIDAAFLSLASRSILYGLSETFTVLVLYTVYVVLFLFSLYTIVHRNSNGRRFMLVTSSGMFLLATSDMLISVLQTAINISLIKAIVQSDTVATERLSRVYDNLGAAYDLRLITNNLLTDLLFLYRCYVIWGSQRTVLILPGAFIFTTCSFNDFLEVLIIDVRVPYIMAGATNVILMCLTAGRIWYMSREARNVHGKAFRRRYHTAIAMILESGALYCLVLLLYIISISLVWESDAVTVFRGVCNGLLGQMINIIPTLIFVRVGMGHCQWIQESPPVEIRSPPVRTPKLQEEGFPEDVCSEVIEIK